LGKEQPIKALKMHQSHGQEKQEHQETNEQPGRRFQGQARQLRRENPQGGQIGQELFIGTDNITGAAIFNVKRFAFWEKS
jgi:hypothetical protein